MIETAIALIIWLIIMVIIINYVNERDSDIDARLKEISEMIQEIEEKNGKH